MTVPAVIYGAKSTEEEKTKQLRGGVGSIDTQLRQCRDMAAQREWLIVESLKDDGFSAFKSNRGPGLERAKRAAVAAAEQYGECMLVVQHADRLARGAGDAPGAADHLGELFFWCRRHNVRLRSPNHTDAELDDPLRVVLLGERNVEDSKRKAGAVADGKRRRFEAGDSTGPVPFGYRLVDKLDDSGNVLKVRDRVVTERVPDEATAPILVQLFEKAAEGATLGDLTRWLNGTGHRTKRGNPFGRSRARSILRNAYYCGLVEMHGERRQGNHPPLISRDLFDRVQALFERPIARPRSGGRSEVALLSGLLTCGRCGHGIWHRKDTGRYACGNVRHATGVCDLPSFNASTADLGLLKHLDGVFVDFETTIARINEERTMQRNVLEADLSRLHAEFSQLDRDEELFSADYRRAVREDDTGGRLAATKELERVATDREHLGDTIAAVEAQCEEWTAEPEVDRLLDWWNELAAAVRGRVTGARSVREANAALRGLLSRVTVHVRGQQLTMDFVLSGAEYADDGTVDMTLLSVGLDQPIRRVQPPGGIVRYTKVNPQLSPELFGPIPVLGESAVAGTRPSAGESE